MTSDPALWLAQAQSFLSLGFMAVFAALGLGLVWLLVWFRLRSVRRLADAGWLAAYRFWVRIFALAATLAAAAGAAVLLLLPGLWPGLPERMAEVASPVLAWTLAAAFVSGACFLGPMLFGERHLPPRWHACTVVLVAVGTSLTVICMLVLASWMQTPAGAVQARGQFVVHDWAQVIGNPTMPWSVGLTLAASGLCAACVVLAVTAWQAHTRPANAGERLAFRSALVLALASALTGALVLALPRTARLAYASGADAASWGAFAVHNAIPLNEVVTDAAAAALALVLGLSVVVYAALLVAFVAIVRHAARYGVVPVGRSRRGGAR